MALGDGNRLGVSRKAAGSALGGVDLGRFVQPASLAVALSLHCHLGNAQGVRGASLTTSDNLRFAHGALILRSSDGSSRAPYRVALAEELELSLTLSRVIA